MNRILNQVQDDVYIMRAFIAVFAIVLLAFGASILYYRGDFGGPAKPDTTTISSTQSTSDGTPPSNPGSAFDIAQSPNSPTTLGAATPAPAYSSLSITQTPTGNIQVGNSVDFKAMGKDTKTAALVNVNADWTVSDATIGTLTSSKGESTTFNGLKPGTAKITAKYQSLTATTNAVVVAKVLGTPTNSTTAPTTTTTTPAKPAVTAVEIRLYDTNGTRLNSGDTRTYTAQVFYSDGTLKSVDVNFSVDPGDLGTLNRTKGSSVDFKASRSGNGSLKATLGNLTSSLHIQIN